MSKIKGRSSKKTGATVVGRKIKSTAARKAVVRRATARVRTKASALGRKH